MERTVCLDEVDNLVVKRNIERINADPRGISISSIRDHPNQHLKKHIDLEAISKIQGMIFSYAIDLIWNIAPIVLSAKADGGYVCVDGHRRRDVLKELGFLMIPKYDINNKPILIIHHELTEAEENDLWLSAYNEKPVSQLNEWDREKLYFDMHQRAKTVAEIAKERRLSEEAIKLRFRAVGNLEGVQAVTPLTKEGVEKIKQRIPITSFELLMRNKDDYDKRQAVTWILSQPDKITRSMVLEYNKNVTKEVPSPRLKVVKPASDSEVKVPAEFRGWVLYQLKVLDSIKLKDSYEQMLIGKGARYLPEIMKEVRARLLMKKDQKGAVEELADSLDALEKVIFPTLWFLEKLCKV